MGWGETLGRGYDRGLDVVRHFVQSQRASVQELGRYVARVGLNASKGSGGGETTMSREKSREAKLG